MGHPLFARFCAATSPAMERGVGPYRDELLDGLTGQVIDVGAGPGVNFGHYPDGVASVLAAEPEPYLRDLAEQAAGFAPAPVKVVDAVAERLPADDHSVDAVVFSFVLCTVPDPGAAVGEAVRVLRPGGQVRFFEHVRAGGRLAYGAQRLLAKTIFPTLFGGCHPGRDTLTALQDAGLVIDSVRRLGFGDTSMPFPTSPQILGTATLPA